MVRDYGRAARHRRHGVAGEEQDQQVEPEAHVIQSRGHDEREPA
jgi:hypothetical protein